MEMNFNNFTVSQLFTIKEVKISILPKVNISSKNVPSRHGTIFQGAQIGEREITVDIMLKQDYNYQYDEEGVPSSSVFNNYVRSIVYYLQTDEPCKLIFSDEPDRYYWAICTGIDIQRMLKIGEGSITFLCNDPYMYATKENVFELNSSTGKYHVDNTGTVESYPKVKVTFQDDATYLGVVTPESVVQIGTLTPEKSTATKQYKYSDNLKTMDNWYYGSQATMSTDCEFDPNVTCTCNGEVMKPALIQYDESTKPQSPYGYKGTQMITDLETKYQSKYFTARLQFDFFSSSSSVRDPKQTGALQVHLLDINNNQIACCGLNDHDTTVELTNVYCKLGYDDVYTNFPKLPTPTTKRYTKVFDNESDVPSDAKIVDSYERTKDYKKVRIAVNNAPVFKSTTVTYKSVKTAYQAQERYYDKKTKRYKYRTVTKYKYVKQENPMTRVKIDKEYRLKAKTSGWACIYLNDACTRVGYIQNKYIEYTDPETETVYVYDRKIYPDKNIGSFTDMWGYFLVSRKPHKNGKGDIWEFEMYRLKKVIGGEKATRLFKKTFTDSTGTKYTHAGKLAKVAVSFVSREDNKPISRMSFNYLSIQTLSNNIVEENEPHLIASVGDILEIDFSVPTVELNGESILHEVDIGSRFDPLQPFMQSEVEIKSDAGIIGEVSLTDKFL